jgi:hypothetical protein
MFSHSKLISLNFVIAILTIIAILIADTSNTRAQPNLNIFGMEDGNSWNYDNNSRYTVDALDQGWYPREYWVEIRENGTWTETEVFGIEGGELKLWNLNDNIEDVYMRFDNGLTVAWFPMAVGEEKTSTTAIGSLPGFSMTATARVMAYEQVTLNFDTFETYKVMLTMTVTWSTGSATDISYYWVTPYLGRIKREYEGIISNVTSFGIGGGAITQVTDADLDGLKDYEEFIKYHTEWENPDTDNDGCQDGAEFYGGRDPLTNDPEGDLNMDCAFGIEDAIIALKDLSQPEIASAIKKEADLNGDNKIGEQEIIFVLQKLSGLR